VLAGESCDSDGGVIYAGDGRWLADGTAGTWRIKRGHLVETVLEREGSGGVMQTLADPVSYTEQIEVLGQDEFVARRKDGSERRFRRCTTSVELGP
jgi:hypothetical protein